MKVANLLIAFFILGIVQITCLHYFGVFAVKPDLFLLIVFISALFFPSRWAILTAVLAGLCKDIFGMRLFGLDILLFSFFSFVIMKVCRKISVDDDLSRTLFIFLVALAYNISSGLVALYSGSLIPLGVFLRIVILGSLYTALLLPLIFKLTKVNI